MTQEQNLLLDFYYNGKRKFYIPQNRIQNDSIKPNWIDCHATQRKSIPRNNNLRLTIPAPKKIIPAVIEQITNADLLVISGDSTKKFLAFKYTSGTKSSAPVCVSKGTGDDYEIALKVARQKNVMIFEKLELIQSSFNEFFVSKEILPKFYAVFANMYATLLKSSNS